MAGMDGEQRSRRFLALLALALLLAGPADARSSDPSRSTAAVEAPGLAPGVWGTAPLYGDLDPAGGFSLRAPASSVSTGSRLYDGFLHRMLGGTITLEGRSPHLISASGRTRILGVQAAVFVAGRSATVPLTVREVRTGNGTWLRAYCRVGLEAYGIRGITGGPPGPLRVAINAFFPGK